MSLARDVRGAALAELVIVAGPLFLTFFTLVQLAGGYTSKLMVEHAARTSARAAVVILPPNPGAPADGPAQVGRAAELALGPWASHRLLHDVRATAKVSDGRAAVHVSAVYDCGVPIGGLVVCGLERRRTIHADATLPHQGARYQPFVKSSPQVGGAAPAFLAR